MGENATLRRGDQTRQQLLTAAIEVFGRDGFHAGSTRAIARAAGVNQALISYHFGGKDGLYQSVFTYIAERLDAELRPQAEALIAALDQTSAAQRPERALDAIEAIIFNLAVFLASPDAAGFSRLIIREQQDPTAAFDLIYDAVMGELLEILCRLLGYLLGKPATDAETRVRSLMLMGNVLVFFIARGSSRRFLGWDGVSPEHLEELHGYLRSSLRAQLTPGDSL